MREEGFAGGEGFLAQVRKVEILFCIHAVIKLNGKCFYALIIL